MSKFTDFLIDLMRQHSAKVVGALFTLVLFVFPALGSRIEGLKEPTAIYMSAVWNTVFPTEQHIGEVPVEGGGVVITQESVADKFEAKADAAEAKAEEEARNAGE